MSRFNQARDEWNREVEELAADMIRAGTPPDQALIEAEKRVSANRRSKIEGDAMRLLESIGRKKILDELTAEAQADGHYD